MESYASPATGKKCFPILMEGQRVKFTQGLNYRSSKFSQKPQDDPGDYGVKYSENKITERFILATLTSLID